MPGVTIAFAVAFIVLGVAGYFGTGRASVTALIPAFFGVVLLGVALLARNPRRIRTAALIGVVLAVLGIAGSFRGLRQIGAVLSGEEVQRPAAVVSQTVMAALAALYALLAARYLRSAPPAR